MLKHFKRNWFPKLTCSVFSHPKIHKTYRFMFSVSAFLEKKLYGVFSMLRKWILMSKCLRQKKAHSFSSLTSLFLLQQLTPPSDSSPNLTQKPFVFVSAAKCRVPFKVHAAGKKDDGVLTRYTAQKSEISNVLFINRCVLATRKQSFSQVNPSLDLQIKHRLQLQNLITDSDEKFLETIVNIAITLFAT